MRTIRLHRHAGYETIKFKRHLDVYADWAGSSRVSANAFNSTAVVFTCLLKRSQPLMLGNTEVPWGEQVSIWEFTSAPNSPGASTFNASENALWRNSLNFVSFIPVCQ